MKKNSYVTPTAMVLAILSESSGILADSKSGRYGVNVDGTSEIGGPAIEDNPDDIDAKGHQSTGVWDD